VTTEKRRERMLEVFRRYAGGESVREKRARFRKLAAGV